MGCGCANAVQPALSGGKKKVTKGKGKAKPAPKPKAGKKKGKK